MTSSRELPDPFQTVAAALERPADSITIDSAMYRDHGWDSFGHVSVVAAIEEACGVSIPDEDVLKYRTMTAIAALFNKCREAGRE